MRGCGGNKGPGLIALLLLSAILAGCASSPRPARPTPPRTSQPPSDEPGGECAPFARNHSAVKIFGDAYTWWDQAKNHYSRRMIPIKGSVMVLHNYAGENRAHVAVVRRIVSPHEIRIDHSNWLNDGKVYKNNPVRDASAAQDWSQVNVYNMQAGVWGRRAYTVQGFIGPDKPLPKNREDDISNLFSNAAPDSQTLRLTQNSGRIADLPGAEPAYSYDTAALSVLDIH